MGETCPCEKRALAFFLLDLGVWAAYDANNELFGFIAKSRSPALEETPT